MIPTINKTYDLTSKVIDIKPFDGGYLSNNQIVLCENGERFFLKRYRSSVSKDILRIEDTESLLSQYGVPVLLGRLTVDNTRHFVFEDTACVLYDYIDYPSIPRPALSSNHLSSLGVLLASIHHAGENANEDLKTPQNEFWSNEKTLKTLNEVDNILNTLSELNSFDKVSRKSIDIKKVFIANNSIHPETLSLGEKTITHGDFHEGNVFFDQNGDVVTVFDLEKTRYGYASLELARSMMLLCFDDGFSDGNFAKATDYLKGYRSVREIAEIEFSDALKVYCIKLFYSTWVEVEHYKNSNSKIDHFLVSAFTNLEYLENNIDTFVSSILSRCFID